MTFIQLYLIAFVIFLVVDMIWLVGIAKKLYSKELGFIMAPKPNLLAAGICYVIFIVGLVFFVIDPAMAKDSWSFALLVGMLFGFITYSTYDLTNLATLKNWPIRITVIDMIWGTSLGGLVSVVTFFIAKALKI